MSRRRSLTPRQRRGELTPEQRRARVAAEFDATLMRAGLDPRAQVPNPPADESEEARYARERLYLRTDVPLILVPGDPG